MVMHHDADAADGADDVDDDAVVDDDIEES